ncbi:SRPBCC family protein [Streptomyces triticiradicis]
MEHEVFVPFPARRLREALADPVRVAHAIPGLQQDASAVADGAANADKGSPPVPGAGRDTADTSSPAGGGRDTGSARVAGRLKVRVAGHTITYRGAFRVTAQGDGSYAVEGDATEARGGGAVKLALTLRLLPADGGTTLAFGGTASGDGRVAELPHDAVSSTGRRLLNRFGETLAADLAAGPGPAPGAGSGPRPGDGPATDPGSGPETGTGQAGGTGQAAGSEAEAGAPAEARPGRGPDLGPEAEPEFDLEPELEPDAELEADSGIDEEPDTEADPGVEADVSAPSFGGPADDEEFDGEDFVEEAGRADAMAEAAHARRTMIGRSAEEVDHAPPRGRYAPVPPPEATAARATLRWAAPAAALALASAIALTRALRKRR